MTQIIRPDLLTGSPSFASEPLPIAQSFIEIVNGTPTDQLNDVLRASLEASITAIASLELRLSALVKAVGAVEVQAPKLELNDITGSDG